MTTPNIDLYLQNTLNAVVFSANYYIVTMCGSTVFIYDILNSRINRITGSGTFNGGIYPIIISGLSPSIQSACFGVSPDQSLLFLADQNQGSSSRFVTVNTSTGEIKIYTNGNDSPSTKYVDRPQGNIYVQNNSTFYVTEATSEVPYQGSVVKVILSGSTYTTSAQCTSVSSGGCIGCTLLGDDTLLFTSSNFDVNYLYSCSLSSPGGSATLITPSDGAHNYVDIFAINGLNANSTTYNFLFLLASSGNVYQYTLSGSVATLVNTSGVVIPTPVTSITGSVSQGNTSGNMRLFIAKGSVPNCNVVKLYNPSSGGTTGPTGVSTGGDPHTHTLTGKSVIIVRDTPFEYLDTHPFRISHSDGEESISLYEDNDIRTYIECDCFSIKNKKDDFSNQIEEDHLNELITNLDDSYLKYVTIYFEEKVYRINMITLLLDDEGDALLPFSKINEINTGREVHFSLREIGEIYLSKIDFFEPGTVTLKSKYVKNTAFMKRTMKIKARDYSLTIEFTRTRCIHLSDMYLEIEGRRDPFTFSGVVIDGDVHSPRLRNSL